MLYKYTIATRKILILQLLKQKYSVALEKFITYLAVKGLTLHCRLVFSNHLDTDHMSRLRKNHSKVSAIETSPHTWLSSLLPTLFQLLSSPYIHDRCAVWHSLASTWKLTRPRLHGWFHGCISLPSGGRAVSGKHYMRLQLILTALRLKTTETHDQKTLLLGRELSPLSTS